MKAIFNKAKDVAISCFNKIQELVNPTLSVVGKVSQGVAAAMVGVVAYTSNAHAVIAIDTSAILADVSIIGTAVLGIVLATVAFKIAKSMLGATR